MYRYLDWIALLAHAFVLVYLYGCGGWHEAHSRKRPLKGCLRVVMCVYGVVNYKVGWLGCYYDSSTCVRVAIHELVCFLLIEELYYGGGK